MEKKEALKDASGLYEVERRALYGERPGFRISELQISPTQTVPWHFHNNIDDTFYVVAGKIRLFLRASRKRTTRAGRQLSRQGGPASFSDK